MEQFYFSFYDIPEFIIKKRYSKKDYEDIMKILLKVKKQYIEQKSKEHPEKPIEKINITDEDLVPLDLFDIVLSQIENKWHEKIACFNDLISACKQECASKIKQLKVDTEKTKKIVENSTFIQYLNSRLEKTHT